MTGYIKLEVIDAGDDKCCRISGDVELMSVSEFDKVALLDAFMQGLYMSDEDVLKALLMRATVVVSGASTGMSFDMDTLNKMREIKNGGEG